MCLLPPILHYITGPFGPFIGGVVVGMRGRLSAREGALVGVGMGLIVLAIATVVTAIALQAGVLEAHWRRGIPVIWVLPLIVWLQASLLGAGGAMLGSRIARAQDQPRPE